MHCYNGFFYLRQEIMSYLPLEEFKHAWIFRHQSMPASSEQQALIKPMTAERSNVLWDTFISKNAIHSDDFGKNDWPANNDNFSSTINWEARWESDDNDLPLEILDHIDWQDNTTVYYCLNRNQILETTWANFKQCWKNFLFLDDGTILLGKKRDQVLQFHSTGDCKLGIKP